MRAHAPGSLTGIYAPPPQHDPEAASRGASVAVEDGVTVAVEPADETVVVLEGERVSMAPVEGLLAELGVSASVALDPDVPIGHGFGASGAATLATALAANAEFGLGHDRETLLGMAHRAELAAGTGQGDVFVQARGGFCWSGSDGGRRRAVEGDLEWTSRGPIDTEAVLADADFRERAACIGPGHIDALGEAPSLRTFVSRSREYVDATGLATEGVAGDGVAADLERVAAAGGVASVALFGETVFAVDVEGVLDRRTAVSNVGARVLSG